MLRKARIDAQGSLHHIIARGIERRKIFEEKLKGQPSKIEKLFLLSIYQNNCNNAFDIVT
jgi:hypothetical protein